MEAAQHSEAGLLLRRAVDLRAALKVGFRLSLAEVRADEFAAMLILEDERDRLDREQMNSHGRQ